MAFLDLIWRLERLQGPERQLDEELAAALEWSKKHEYVTAPAFTNSIDDAIALMNEVAPSDRWGVGFADGKGSGLVEDEAYTEGPNVAIALCIVSLKAMLRRNGQKLEG
ncbi:hypothetical protein [Neorhizobium alkalisoli]|uniref:hypothetical protein n=1 Tax=Neorhizobium alkalisoli TaxID=528178 RepID=UPI000CF9C008|nr:hypothetical protein [Neorhizobium alkalisoli]